MRTDFLVLCVGIAGFATPTLTTPGAVYAQRCDAPGCTSCGAAPRSTQAPRSAARGIYSRSPDSGERVGESNSMGIRGFGIRLPSISLEMPELRLPSLNRYRRDAYMITDSAHAPYVDGRALEFNPVGADREAAAPERSTPSPRFTPRSPSCDAPAPHCDAPSAAVPGVDERAQNGSDAFGSRDADLQQLREQAILLQKAIDSLANGIAAPAASIERVQLRQKDREIAELRMQLQRMQSKVTATATQGVSQEQTETSPAQKRKPQSTSNVRPVSAEAQKSNRVASEPVAQNGVCNGPQCKAPISESRTQQDDGFQAPLVTKTYTVSRLSSLRPSSILRR